MFSNTVTGKEIAVLSPERNLAICSKSLKNNPLVPLPIVYPKERVQDINKDLCTNICITMFLKIVFKKRKGDIQ